MCSQRSAVIRFINELFGLTPLADLPEEKRARGTADDMVPMGDLFEDFDNDRLLGRAPPHSQR